MREDETIADIILEMRHGLDKSWHDIDREWVHGLAERIEAAAKRESEQHKRKLDRAVLNKDFIDSLKFCAEVAKREKTQHGNAAKMRNALERIDKLTREFVAGNYYLTDFPQMVLDTVATALSAQPTNSEEYAKPNLCKTCLHKPDGCEIYGCTEYEERKGEMK